MSTDMRNWECVIDHSTYMCMGPQVLFSSERAVRFIRIEYTDTSNFNNIGADIEALYLTEPFEIDPVTALSIPQQNVIPEEMLETFFGKGKIVDGYVRHNIFDEENPYMGYGIPCGSIIL
uniref:F5/8 type C domain-containing protein n=1 Tax=Panagrellus redivivus TaxID=6233 RepID=A0A7E4VWR3_PANRE